MKKILQALLSLSAMAPGIAAAQDVPDERGHRPERGEVHRADARQGGFRQARQADRGDGEQRADQDLGRGRPQFRQDSQPAVVPPLASPERRDRQGGGFRRSDDLQGGRHDGWADRREGDRDRDGRDRQDHGYRQDRGDRGDHADRDDRRRRWDRSDADWRDNFRDDRRFDDRRFANGGGWSRGWRQDGRYDWSGYRSANRGAYRLPRYYAPYGFGYGYRRYGIGSALSGGFFGQNYWIDDPYDYRLPPAYGPYRWVRYYDDALLVDVRTGTIVDAVYGIFD